MSKGQRGAHEVIDGGGIIDKKRGQRVRGLEKRTHRRSGLTEDLDRVRLPGIEI